MIFNYDEMEYHPTTERLVDYLVSITQNQDRHLFRTLLTFYFGCVSGHMRCSVTGFGNGLIPANIYTMALSTTGTGKGYTMKTMKDDVLNNFRSIFLDETFIASAQARIDSIAMDRASKRNTEFDDEATDLTNQFNNAGNILFQFPDATVPAIKQLRHKLAIADLGAFNFEVDEIALNLLNANVSELINLYLEVYDTGRIEEKLIKNTSEAMRTERIEAITPANMLLTGDPTLLFDGANVEERFFNMLITGYARRCFFSIGEGQITTHEFTAEELVKNMRNQSKSNELQELSLHFAELADISYANKSLVLKEDAAIYLMEYKINCGKRVEALKVTQTLERAELMHRYFKVLKLATSYAFADKLDHVPISYLQYAIKLAEESGKHFHKIVNPEKPYIKLANYLADNKDSSTLSDLDLNLPYYKGAKATKDEMLNNAISWGYKNNIVISKHFIDQILFLRGSRLEETSLDNLILSVSQDVAYDYEPEVDFSFDDLAMAGQLAMYNFCNHYFVNNHRSIENLCLGFNVIVLDIDDGTPMEVAETLLGDYYFVMYETKRSTEEFNRYRILMPISHVLELERDDYAEFMRNVISDLPFDVEVDDASLQPEKKWLTHNKSVYINDATEDGSEPKLLDALQYIPRTRKNEVRMKAREALGDITNLQYWFITNTAEGNRNKQVFRYAMVLADTGGTLEEIEGSVKDFNSNLSNPLSERELEHSVFKSLRKKLA